MEKTIMNTQREIKFRAIPTEEAKTRGEQYSKPVYFTLEDLMRHKIVFAYPEHWIFNKHTNLKDKNGKEIYEGDIVKYKYGVMGKVWQLLSGRWIVDIPSENGSDFQDHWNDEVEVISDIYDTKGEWEELANIIIKCRNGSMDEKQFKATVSNAFQQIEQRIAMEINDALRIKEMLYCGKKTTLGNELEDFIKHRSNIK